MTDTMAIVITIVIIVVWLGGTIYMVQKNEFSNKCGHDYITKDDYPGWPDIEHRVCSQCGEEVAYHIGFNEEIPWDVFIRDAEGKQILIDAYGRDEK